QEQLEATITDAIQDGEEKMLPGLGVLFELIWKESSEQDKQEMIEALEQGVKQANTSG
ncbi:small acid-soluble spore protein SspI, partial [Lentibacillus sp.]|uniref:small acid-soluble spore protein SspI n=1 Tax=Lentibacillus sp. TaxID=1925746 RepID=UPI002B4B89CB